MEFLKSTRIGEDEGGLTQDNLFNKSHTDYMLENYYKTSCNMKQPIEFATSQANVNYCAESGSGTDHAAKKRKDPNRDSRTVCCRIIRPP